MHEPDVVRIGRDPLTRYLNSISRFPQSTDQGIDHQIEENWAQESALSHSREHGNWVGMNLTGHMHC